MMSIGAGAQQQVLAFIEQLGVRNLIVEAREAADDQSYQKVRKTSPGLTERDLRVIRANVPGISRPRCENVSLRRNSIPKPIGESPQVFGVEPTYRGDRRASRRVGPVHRDAETGNAQPVCVLGEAARSALFGARIPSGSG